MAVTNISRPLSKYTTGDDGIVIVDNFESIRGGRSLNTSGYPLSVIKSGHVIIRETATGDYKPMPIVVSGAITGMGSLTAGSGYTNDGTYTGVSLTGGSGSGAEATVTVAGGAVTSVVITDPGTGYKAGDTLSAAAADIGTGGSGFAIGVASVDGSSSTYNSLPGGHTYAGILIATIDTDLPFAGIMVRGTVNELASPYPVTSIKSAFLTATQNLIRFTSDGV